MSKRNYRNIILLSGALVAVAVVAAWLMRAPDVMAAESCRCSPERSTAIVTGTDPSDCHWAEMDARQQAEALVLCEDNTCWQDFEVIDDNNCQKIWPEGVFQVTARINYSCEICIERPDLP